MTKIIFTIMVLIALAAFGTGPLLYKDQPNSNIPPEALRRLKTQLALGPKVRPLVLQVTEARLLGDLPDDVEGTGVFRSLFGVPVGYVDLRGRQIVYDFHPWRWLGIWLGFLLTQCLLSTFLIRHALK